MIQRRFYINTVIRVVFMALTCLMLAFVLIKKSDWYLGINVLLLLVFQAGLLISYINRMNRDLTGFFTAISSDDSTIVYKKAAPSPSFEKLYEQFDKVNQRIQQLKLENTRRAFYLQHLVESAGIGLISYKTDGSIDILNPFALHLLNLSPLKNHNNMDDLDPEMVALFRQMEPGEQGLVNFRINDEILPLSVRVSEFVIQEETVRLLTIQNIRNELEETELLSWQKLIRTLTHEIMNSIGPISSSIKTIKSFYENDASALSGGKTLMPAEILADTVRGLDIIDERAQGMLQFVDKFRSLTNVPVLQKVPIKVHDLLEGIAQFFRAEACNNQIQLSVRVIPESLLVTADKQLLEQVLINLVTNSIHALEDCSNKKIRITAFTDLSGKRCIQVSDNGRGIREEISDKIFIPFFTTREKGSGIGLSLSRQIIRMHRGRLAFKSVPGKETVFSIVL
jgi:nitrogen fixation/metabolism regulation signal transduction histidine kinase